MPSEFSQFLENKRRSQELTLRSFCMASGANASYWSALERGHAPAPTELSFYKKIKEILKLTESEFELLLKLKETHTWTEEPKFW